MAEIAAQVTGENQPTGVEQPDTIKTFSFNDVHEQAMKYGEDTPEPTVQEQVQPAVKPALADASREAGLQPKVEEAPNVDNATAKQLAQLKDDDLVEVTVDGQQVQMPWKDARGGVMRQAKFTKEMTALRQEQAAFNTERASVTKLQQDHQTLVSLLNNKELLKGFLQQAYPDLVAQAQQQVVAAVTGQTPQSGDAGDIATVGQVQAVAKQFEENLTNLVQALETGLQERETALVQEIQDKNETLKLATEINGTIESMFKEHPHMKELVPEAEQMLRFKVLQLAPKTPEETVQAFKDVFAGWVEQFDSAVTNANKSKVVTRAKLEKVNIQPPGGTGVQPQPTNFKKTNAITGKTELDWSKLHEAALAYEK